MKKYIKFYSVSVIMPGPRYLSQEFSSREDAILYAESQSPKADKVVAWESVDELEEGKTCVLFSSVRIYETTKGGD